MTDNLYFRMNHKFWHVRNSQFIRVSSFWRPCVGYNFRGPAGRGGGGWRDGVSCLQPADSSRSRGRLESTNLTNSSDSHFSIHHEYACGRSCGHVRVMFYLARVFSLSGTEIDWRLFFYLFMFFVFIFHSFFSYNVCFITTQDPHQELNNITHSM